ncbi:MAG TPA: CAP domain-containing protein [Sphingomicrobium sp.]|nr:CAP domain-containing protein [Sphingomicrobium sp.]
MPRPRSRRRAWLSALVAGLAAATSQSTPAQPILTIPPATAWAMRVTDLHNRVRAAAGVPPIHWDAGLAAAADKYAAQLARTGRWGHSPQEARAGQGENLWMGTRGAFNVDQMLGAWASEARLFRPGRFPRVSRNGNWTAVGHYTQMIWRGSFRLGCALRSSAHYDYLVCRYSPPGNVVGVGVP